MSRGNVALVVQARTGSVRLPGKVLAPIGGRPMLQLQLARLAGCGKRVIVATSDRAGDDAVADVAQRAGVDVVRGSERDVLARYALVLDRYPVDTVVRLTADCPLADPVIVLDTLELHRATQADYTSNVLPRTFPRGLDVEVVSAGALRTAAAEARDAPDREHVTPYVYRRPERFRLANLASGDDLGEEPWTVDTSDDLDRLRSIVDALDDPVTAGWREILAVVGPHAEPYATQVHLKADPGPEPGSAPWRRRWVAELDGRPIGTAEVAAGAGGATRRVVAEDRAMTRLIEAELERILVGDQQTRT